MQPKSRKLAESKASFVPRTRKQAQSKVSLIPVYVTKNRKLAHYSESELEDSDPEEVDYFSDSDVEIEDLDSEDQPESEDNEEN